MNETRNDLLYCREQVQSVNPLFRVSHVFAGPEVSDRVLAINALFAAIEEICSTASDDSVAARKLSWWRGEMDRAANGAGDHPISAVLKRAGAFGAMPENLVQQLLDAAEALIDPQPPRDTTELESVCIRTGLPQVQLELSVCGARGAEDAGLRAMAARRGLIQLVRERPGCRNRDAFWWVPLDLLARHSVRRAELTGPDDTGAVRTLKSDLLELDCFHRTFDAGCIEDISVVKHNVRHFFAADVLLKRKLQFMNNNSLFVDINMINKAGFGDLFSCWKAARQVSLLR